MRANKPWRSANRYKGASTDRVILWLDIYGDSFAVRDCWRDYDGRWTHLHNGKPAELQSDYVTHWAPADTEPPFGPQGQAMEWWNG